MNGETHQFLRFPVLESINRKSVKNNLFFFLKNIIVLFSYWSFFIIIQFITVQVYKVQYNLKC